MITISIIALVYAAGFFSTAGFMLGAFAMIISDPPRKARR